MKHSPLLPDLDQSPSVLRTDKVDRLLVQVIDALDAHPEIEPIEAIHCMVDIILAQAYEPDQSLDPAVCGRILEWIQRVWCSGSEDFADAATTVLANLTCDGVDHYLGELLLQETRPPVIAELKQCALEREKKTSPGG